MVLFADWRLSEYLSGLGCVDCFWFGHQAHDCSLAPLARSACAWGLGVGLGLGSRLVLGSGFGLGLRPGLGLGSGSGLGPR